MTLDWEYAEDAAFATANGELVAKIERQPDCRWAVYDLTPQAKDDVTAVHDTQASAKHAVEVWWGRRQKWSRVRRAA